MNKIHLFLSLFTIVFSTSFISKDWIAFAVDEQLSVKLPGHPVTVHQDTIHTDGFEQHLIISSYTDESGYYRISRDDLSHESDNYLTPQGRKEWYSVSPMVEGMLFKAKFLNRETVEINGIDGVDRMYDLPASQKNGHTIKYIRSLLVGKVAYDFWFIPTDVLTNPALKEKKLFFNSIKLKKI
jgi:hypothetical protein